MAKDCRSPFPRPRPADGGATKERQQNVEMEKMGRPKKNLNAAKESEWSHGVGPASSSSCVLPRDAKDYAHNSTGRHPYSSVALYEPFSPMLSIAGEEADEMAYTLQGFAKYCQSCTAYHHYTIQEDCIGYCRAIAQKSIWE